MATSAKLLLAEDSLTIQKVFEVTFQQSGISLTMVDNGIDAVRMARELSPDLVVADVSLPGKDGFHVASELRSPAAGVSCPVLILAGTLSPFDEERFKSCGANGVLFKPFEYQELIDKVEALIRGPKEPVPAPGEKERLTPSAEEPWDFSDILSEAEKEAGAASVSPSVKADDRGRATPSSGVGAGGALSLGDFDVSLEDIEGKPERKETAPKPPPPKQEEQERIAPSPEVPEERSRTVEHIEEPAFDDSPPAVFDLSSALETVEELEEVDFVETIEPHEEKAHRAPPPKEAAPSPSAVFPESAAVVPERPSAPPSPPAGARPTEEQLRQLFAERAQEIFGQVSAEIVEKVMWEMAEKLTKEFTERIRESVENVAWEVIPATTEALIREEIARIREKAGKESS
ncbi:MAG: response regulator [Candidatus Deferrimicrobiaceae bacterium]